MRLDILSAIQSRIDAYVLLACFADTSSYTSLGSVDGVFDAGKHYPNTLYIHTWNSSVFKRYAMWQKQLQNFTPKDQPVTCFYEVS